MIEYKCQSLGEKMLDINQKELLKLVMGYVDDAGKHHVDEVSIEQSLTDIISSIEDLAIEIEKGKWEKETE